jgi:hypothetical protein
MTSSGWHAVSQLRPGAIVPFSKLDSIRLPLFMTGDILK